MTCEVVSDEGVCEWPVAADGLCLIHLLRRLDGFADDELGLPLGTKRPPTPERLCEIVMDTGELCARPQLGRGLCDAHWARRHRSGWSDERMGEPIRAVAEGCEIVMHDGERCTGRHHSNGLCCTHWQRRHRYHWPDQRMGDPIRSASR